MKLNKSLLLSAFLAIPSLAAAQHPCDISASVPTSLTTTTGASLRISFCVAATDTIEAAIMRVNGTPQNLAQLTDVTGPNAQGYKQVQVLLGATAFPVGSYQITVSLYNHNPITKAVQESPQSSPFALTLVNQIPLPSTPINMFIHVG